MKRVKLLVMIMMILSLFGCTADSNLKELSGKWVDLNSEDTLIFNGSKMTWEYGNYKDEYKVRVREENGRRFVTNTGKDSSFGAVSELEITGKGHLLAYEMILDAEGHTYEFVREAEKLELLNIIDDSRDLPKTVRSHEIVSMSLHFYGHPGYKLTDIPNASVSFELENEDGEYSVRYIEVFDSFMGRRYDGCVSEEYVRGLDDVIRSCGIIENNGYYRHNAVNVEGYSLSVEYASGEEVEIGSDGDDALHVVFDLDQLMQYITSNLDFGE